MEDGCWDFAGENVPFRSIYIANLCWEWVD